VDAGIALQVRPLATTAIVTVTVNITKGTPPITVSGTITIKDSSGTAVASKSFSDIISSSPPYSKSYPFPFDVSGLAAGTYTAEAAVTFSNNYGSKSASASAQFKLQQDFFGYIGGVYVYGRGATEPPPTADAMYSLKITMKCPEGYELYVEWDSYFGHYVAKCCARWGTDAEGRRACVGSALGTYCAKNYDSCQKREYPYPPCQWIPANNNWYCGPCQVNWVNCVPDWLDQWSRVLCTGCTP